ncbi:hypothetical protein AGOR_G00188590 [Albula goreensis]|uniref:Uncharacterized protein n=1 Tax=Albula goreensis TaxID=1534307 RepID=A0A8T3CXZ2_9TELE|nr:hypothetical protein AGOR_G00188590 [Albula goreensis]
MPTFFGIIGYSVVRLIIQFMPRVLLFLRLQALWSSYLNALAFNVHRFYYKIYSIFGKIPLTFIARQKKTLIPPCRTAGVCKAALRNKVRYRPVPEQFSHGDISEAIFTEVCHSGSGGLDQTEEL